MADYRSPMLQIPQRKPLASGNAGLQFHSSGSPNPQHRQQQAMRPQSQQSRPQAAPSSYYPNQMHAQQQMPPALHHPQHPQHSQHPQHQQHQHPQHMNPNYPVRRASNATTSTTSTGGNGSQPSGHPNAHADIRRSSSSRSGHAPAPIGYVALMRKQKATVWCDRAQQEDPRVVAQRRAAKQRAAIEVHGGGGRSATLTSSGKIRHNTSSRSMSYNTGTMVGAGVPLRLSANEIGDGEDDKDNDGSPFHRRTGSGRSSTGSSRFPSGYQRPQQGRFSSSSNSNTPPNMDPADRIQTDIPEIVETPAPLKPDEEKDYFASINANAGANGSSAAAMASSNLVTDKSKPDRAGSTHSLASELEEDFGTVTEMAAPSGAVAAANRGKKVDDLKRRGSVDDRSTSMSNVRLFVANPDLSD